MTASPYPLAGVAVILMRPVPARTFLLLGGGLLALAGAFCTVHSWLTGQSVSLAASLAWSASILLPWLIVLEAGKRRMLRRGRLGSTFMAAAIGAAFAASVSIQAAYLAAAAGEVAMAGLAWQRLPAVILVALPLIAAELLLRHRQRATVNEEGCDPDVGLLRLADWIKGAGNYVEVRLGHRTHIYRISMERCERLLGDGFVRIHRSTIVNGAAIAGIEKDAKGALVKLRDGTHHRVGDRYRHRLAG